MSLKKDCWSVNDEDFRYGSLAELLKGNPHLKVGDMVYVGDSEHPDLSEFIDADDVLDTIRDRASDIGGDFAEGYPNVSGEAKEELEQLLRGWLEKYARPNFWRVINVIPYALDEADFVAASSEPT